MRTITTHAVNPANEALTIEAADAPHASGANHHYAVSWRDKAGNLHVRDIKFQEGPILEEGVNGLTHEALLAIVADRLRGFQSGEFACGENAMALEHIEHGLTWLKQRTLARMARNVEGTSQV